MSKHIDRIAFIINYHTSIPEPISSLIAVDALEPSSDVVMVTKSLAVPLNVVGESKFIVE